MEEELERQLAKLELQTGDKVARRNIRRDVQDGRPDLAMALVKRTSPVIIDMYVSILLSIIGGIFTTLHYTYFGAQHGLDVAKLASSACHQGLQTMIVIKDATKASNSYGATMLNLFSNVAELITTTKATRAISNLEQTLADAELSAREKCNLPIFEAENLVEKFDAINQALFITGIITTVILAIKLIRNVYLKAKLHSVLSELRNILQEVSQQETPEKPQRPRQIEAMEEEVAPPRQRIAQKVPPKAPPKVAHVYPVEDTSPIGIANRRKIQREKDEQARAEELRLQFDE
jgi:cell division protein FtsL